MNDRFVSVMRRRAMPPATAAALASAGFFAARLLAARARAIALPPRQQKRTWVHELRIRARPGIRIRMHMRMWPWAPAHVQCSPIPHSSMPAGQRKLVWLAISGCAPRAAAGGSQPGLGLGLISAAMEVNSHMQPREHANADMRIGCQAASAKPWN